jgi:hypothetical protein
MGGAFSSAGVPPSFCFRSSSDALLMACCCFCARLGTFGSGVEFAAGWGFEQEQIIPSKPAANRVITVFLMSILSANFESSGLGISSLATIRNDIANGDCQPMPGFSRTAKQDVENEKRAVRKCRAFSL